MYAIVTLNTIIACLFPTQLYGPRRKGWYARLSITRSGRVVHLSGIKLSGSLKYFAPVIRLQRLEETMLNDLITTVTVEWKGLAAADTHLYA